MNTQLATEIELTILAGDATSRAALPRGSGIRVVSSPSHQLAGKALNVFVFASASKLSDVADFVSKSNSRRQLRALFVRDDFGPYWLPTLFEKAGLRTFRNAVVHGDLTIPLRIVKAWRKGAQKRLIADAKIVNGILYVIACDLAQFEAPVKALPPLARIPGSGLTHFVIDEDGSFLFWPDGDIHLNLEAIRFASDPKFRVRALRAQSIRNERYGKAIERTREQGGLTQGAITGMSERQVRRIEKGAVVTEHALTLLAKAHRMTLHGYLNVLARESRRCATETSEHLPKATEVSPTQNAATQT